MTMSTTLYVVFGLVVLGILIGLVWRLASNRQSIPWPSWLGWMVEMDNRITDVNRARVITGLLELDPAMKVLDAGCGPGRLTLPLAEAFSPQGEVLALDIQDDMLDRPSAVKTGLC